MSNQKPPSQRERERERAVGGISERKLKALLGQWPLHEMDECFYHNKYWENKDLFCSRQRKEGKHKNGFNLCQTPTHIDLFPFFFLVRQNALDRQII